MAKKVKKLYRAAEKDSVIAGVCAGIGDYFGVDPVIVRLIFALLIFCGGLGLLAYLLAWIIIPRR